MIKQSLLKRDRRSNAVINTDIEGYKSFMNEIYNQRKLEKTILQVQSLDSDVKEIKEMLKILINGTKNG